MKIETFVGQDKELDKAIQKAQVGAREVLAGVAYTDLVMAQAQTLIAKSPDGTFNNMLYTHVITIVYE